MERARKEDRVEAWIEERRKKTKRQRRREGRKQTGCIKKNWKQNKVPRRIETLSCVGHCAPNKPKMVKP